MKIGMMNNPANDVYEEIKFAGENKFDFIDLTLEPPMAIIENINLDNILSLCKKYKLSILGHTNFNLPWASPVKRLKEASMQELTEQLALFNAFGVKLVGVHSHWYQPNCDKEEIIERIIESLTKLVTTAKQYDIKLVLEHTPTGFLNTPESLQPIFDKVKNLLFLLDVGHAQVSGKGKNLTEEFLVHFKDKLTHVHFSDNKSINDDHLPIGAGIIDWENIIMQLKEIHFNKTITLEVWGKDRYYLLYSKDQIRKLWNSIK